VTDLYGVPVVAARASRSSQTLLEQLVLSVFDDATPRTKAEVEAATGLSRAVVAGVLTQLLDAGELAPASEVRVTGRRGRPSALYHRPALAAPVDFVQLDRGQITRVAVVQQDRVLWEAQNRAAPWSASWSEWSTSTLAELDRLHRDNEVAASSDVVIAAPFPVTKDGGAPQLHRAPSHGMVPYAAKPNVIVPEWLRSDPRPLVAEASGVHAQLVNDANLAALGEAAFGAGRGEANVLFVLVRDGVGAGLIIDGELVDGTHGMAGELAHVQVVSDGPFCLCGNRGCLATQTQDPRVLEVLSAQYAHPMTWPDVEQLVSDRDVLALRVLRELGRLVGRALAAVVTVLDLDSVILDGALGAAAPPFLEGLELELDHRCPPRIAHGVQLRLGELDRPIAQGAWAAAMRRRRRPR
jgi:predicted NBD/HSP70 family sugar kinase